MVQQDIGIEFIKGANAYFNYVNDLGGINGREIELITLDDSYEPQYAIQNTNELIKNKKCSRCLEKLEHHLQEAVLPIIKEYNIPFLTPLTGVDSVRDNESGLIFNLRNSYKDETKAMIQYLVTELKLKNSCILSR